MILILGIGAILLLVVLPMLKKTTAPGPGIKTFAPNPGTGTYYNSEGMPFGFEDNEYVTDGIIPDTPYSTYTILHIPTNVRVESVGVRIPLSWRFNFYPQILDNGVIIK